jgi:hypothetical protein
MAGLALAHAQTLRGASDGAQETLERALSLAQKGRGADIYWSYLIGNHATNEGVFATLRAGTAR